jgi:SnoaL-like domain
MSQSISTLLIRNLDDVFGEGNPQRRRAAIDEIFTEDAVFYEPGAVHRGRDEIDRIAGVIRATHPTFRYTPTAAPQELHNAGRVHWVSGPPEGPPAYAGVDFKTSRKSALISLTLIPWHWRGCLKVVNPCAPIRATSPP